MWTEVLDSFESIADSHSKSALPFVRNQRTAFQSHCPTLHSLWQQIRLPVVPHLHQPWVVRVFWLLAILIDMYWYLIVSICNFLRTCEVEHLFVCSFDISLSSLVKNLFRFLPVFLTGLFVFLMLSFKGSLHILDTSHLPICVFKYFLLVCDLSLHSLNSVFLRAEVFNFNEIQLINFFFRRSCFWCHIQKIITKPKVTEIFFYAIFQRFL